MTTSVPNDTGREFCDLDLQHGLVVFCHARGYTQRMEKEVGRKHIGYECLRGCSYGLAYFKCPEHGTLPIAKRVRVVLLEPIESPRSAESAP